MIFSTALLLAAAIARAAYVPKSTFSGEGFFDAFEFFNESDPNNGFVHYVDRATAIDKKYISMASHALSNNSIYIGVDSENTYPASGPGRQSIRLHGTQSFTHGLITLDIYHAPTGCGLWPALWMTNNGGGVWPGDTGEIDIVEYVNDAEFNAVTLHTSEGCKIKNVTDSAPRHRARRGPAQPSMLGTVESCDCWVDAPDQSKNKGCSIAAPATIQNPTTTTNNNNNLGRQRYMTANAMAGTLNAMAGTATAGPAFNDQSGGLYALVWTSSVLEVYFFPRSSIPADLTAASSSFSSSSSPVAARSEDRTVDPADWKDQGLAPVARFEGCDFDRHVGDISLVINTNFCGDWAGGVWESGGCAAKTGVASCAEYVRSNPEAFRDAYWLLGGIEIWEELQQ